MAEGMVAPGVGAINNTTQHMTLVDWLDDLTVRFLLNLPPTELSSVPRICFQIEEAQWFYEDFIRPLNPTLPSLNLRQFLLALFQHCPLLQGFDAAHHVAAYEEFLSYKTRVPVRGAILLDDSMEKAVLVKGYKKGASWSFPRGKINKDEPDLECAIREVYEETGFDIGATGLVKSNLQDDGTVRAIDVNIHQQHLKMFVFRGVALDTYFEPRTRKEIGKISWYNVKDLPGFKRQKGPNIHGQGEAQSTKFYMVAPFLAGLKKWIGQQRRNDAAALQAHHARTLSTNQDVLQTAATEDEGETEQEGFTSDAGFGTGERSADELKRLLSIGGTPLNTAQQNNSSTHTNSLLAMLKGSQGTTTLPQTPFEQIDPMVPAKPPHTPQPHHPRQPSSGYQQQPHVPQYPFASQQVPYQNVHQGQHGNVRPASGSSSGQFAQPLPHHIQQHSGQLSVSGYGRGYQNRPQPGSHANAAASSFSLFQQTQAQPSGYFGGASEFQRQNGAGFAETTGQLASPMQFATGSSKPPATLAKILQDSQKPIGSETPEASKLPNLTTQSKKLLDAFKINTAVKSSAQIQSTGPSASHRSGSLQQAALLDLFKKPGAISASPQPTCEKAIPASPTLTDTTIKPEPVSGAERKPTLNELTRTLLPKKSPSIAADLTGITSAVITERPQQPAHAATKMQTPLAPIHSSESPSMARSQTRGQLFDPMNPKKSVRVASQSRKDERDSSMPQVSILQRSTSQQGPQLPRIDSPKIHQKPKSNENGQPLPQFSILQRPGSAAGKTRHPVPHSPLRHESASTGFKHAVVTRPAEVNPVTQGSVASSDKKEQLLSLFAPAPSTGVSLAPATKSAQSHQAARQPQQHDTLLGLLNGARDPSIELARTPDPPPAPQLMPERRPSSHGLRTNTGQQQSSQQLLLNLFHKPTSNETTSPGTPISPFTLGTPISRELPTSKHPLPLSLQSSLEPRSRLGSMTSAISNGTPSASGQGTPTSATPTKETKGFLLDYLNGVVQKEGHRGAK